MQIPTLALTTGFTERPFASSKWQETFKYLPENIELNWKKEIDELMKDTPTPFNEKYTEWLTNMVGQVHRTGIEIMAGADCPIFYLTPGRSLYKRIRGIGESRSNSFGGTTNGYDQSCQVLQSSKRVGCSKRNHVGRSSDIR